MEILLDGQMILNKDILFKTLKEQINSDEFYGDNLDALWDVLTYGIDNITVTIKNQKKLEKNLGNYLYKLLDLFKSLNDNNVKVVIKNQES